MRITIERLRTLVLIAGVLLIAALVTFLAVARWKTRLAIKEIPKRLGINIQQESNGVTITQAHGPHTLFKLHASRVEQLKEGGRAMLHEVQIELYGEDGSRVDRISGHEFEYDQTTGTATAAGPVEIAIMRPNIAPAVAPKASSKTVLPSRSKPKPGSVNAVAQSVSSGQINVKTSGLSFNQKSGIAATSALVNFETLQGNGSSIGASFDSDSGLLTLEHSVVLNVRRGPETVVIHAGHAEFDRDSLVCHLREATAAYRNGQAAAGLAQLLFRDDGTAVRLDASQGFTLTTATGAHIAAPVASLDFNESNQPRAGRLTGGVTVDSTANGRTLHGSSPNASLAFDPKGNLKQAHLERGVAMHSEQNTPSAAVIRVTRDWHSPVADLDFSTTAKGQTELAQLRGNGGVVLTSRTERASGPALPSRLAADQLRGDFGDGQQLRHLWGIGHASLEQTSASGTQQLTTGDRIEAIFALPVPGPAHARSGTPNPTSHIQSATIDGNVVLVQQQPNRPGEPQSLPLRATGGHAVHEEEGQWLHLTGNPRVDNGGLQLSADKLDLSQATGDAFAHGNVKATWLNQPAAAGHPAAGTASAPQTVALGGQGPAHVVAAEAQLNKSTGEAAFRGHARLWQQANSVAAPVLILDRNRRTLVAQSTSASEPVNVVMLSNNASGERAPRSAQERPAGSAAPSVIRVRAGDLKYSDAERKAILHADPAGSVLADTGTATISSHQAELVLLPPGNHAAPDGGAAQVDRMIARGHVTVASQGRRGAGEQLTYTSETGDYILTGTASAPPRMTDPAHGTVTGESLIFNSRDDSVSVEGNGGKTSTSTTAPN